MSENVRAQVRLDGRWWDLVGERDGAKVLVRDGNEERIVGWAELGMALGGIDGGLVLNILEALRRHEWRSSRRR